MHFTVLRGVAQEGNVDEAVEAVHVWPVLAASFGDFDVSERKCNREMSTAVSRHQILRAYRHIYQHGLRAVQYAQPARYILRDRLRRLFRDGDPANFDQQRINNTLEFLRGAALSKGLEHRIVKNLLFVWFHEVYAKANWSKG